MISQSRPEACPSDLVLDAWAAHELAAERAAELQAHLASCARCQARRAELDQQRSAFLAAAPDLDALRMRTQSAKPTPASNLRVLRRAWVGRATASLVLAALALLAVRPWEHAELTTRSKGAPHLGFFVKHGEQLRRGASGAVVSAGDLLRFTYSSEHELYFALLNKDSQGARSYYPAAGAPAERMPAGSEIALAFSVQLDAQEGAEHMLGVFCPAPFEIAPLLASLAASRALPLSAACTVDDILLNKQATP